MQVAGDLAVGLERGNEGSQGDGGRVGKQLGDLADSADVLDAVLVGEAEVLVEAEADVVAVKAVGGQTEVQQVLLEGGRDGRLARRRQASEPEGEALLLAKLAALGPRKRRVPDNVAVSRRGSAWPSLLVLTRLCAASGLLGQVVAGQWRGRGQAKLLKLQRWAGGRASTARRGDMRAALGITHVAIVKY